MLRLANLEPDIEDDEDSVTVAVAARRLGCAQSTVRELLECGELTGHKVGKHKGGAGPGGVRVHVSAIREYKRRNAIGAARQPANDPAPARRVSHNPGAAEARRELRKMGII
jgi:excisionase family DNA binding protein